MQTFCHPNAAEPHIFTLTEANAFPSRQSGEDWVFDLLHRQIVTLQIAPGTRLSEAGVAGELGTSRQPVHAAFQRLAKLGFLEVRPQKATRVSLIDAEQVSRARFLRLAVEVEVLRRAAERFREADEAAFAENLMRQAKALDSGDPVAFHDLDDAFHALIARAAGLDFAWAALAELRAHEHRIRFLAQNDGAAEALAEHRAMFDHLRANRADLAETTLRWHLGKIDAAMAQLCRTHPDWFLSETPQANEGSTA